MGSATGDTWVMNRLLGRGPRGITPGSVHKQVTSRGGRGPQSVLGEQPKRQSCWTGVGTREEFAGASPGALALAPGRGTLS